MLKNPSSITAGLRVVLMISMVWPPIERHDVAGRCALPSGMCSSRPIAPMASPALRRRARAHPTTQAAPRHVALHVFHCPLAYRDAAGVCINALCDEGERRRTLLAPPFQRMMRCGSPASSPGPDPDQRAHSELAHCLDFEDLDPPRRRACAVRAARRANLHRIRTLGGALTRSRGEPRASKHRLLDAPRLRASATIRDGKLMCAALPASFAVLRFVLWYRVERVRPHAGAERDVRLRHPPSSRRRVPSSDNMTSVRGGRNASLHDAA